MRENLSLESPRSRDNFLRQPQIGAYFTKKAAILQQHRMKFQIKGQNSLGESAGPGFCLAQRRRGAEILSRVEV